MRVASFSEDPVDAGWRRTLTDRLVEQRYLALYGEAAAARPVAEAVVERLAPRSSVLLVGDGGNDGGYAWLLAEGADLAVADLVLVDTGRAPEVRAEVERRARAHGAQGVMVDVAAGEAAQRAFVDGADFALMSTQMRLDLPGAPGRPAPRVAVELRPMTAPEFDTFFAGQAEDYAAERERAGEPPEAARETADRQIAQLLPAGLDSPDQWLFTAWGDGGPVGSLWLSTDRPTTFVYDIVVWPEQRRLGYGEAIMRAAESWAAEHGSIGVGLNVFGHNTGARRLYDRLGYVVTEETHRKAVS